MMYLMPASSNPAMLCRILPLFGEAVRQANQNYQAPPRICEMSALAAVSSACQSLVDVEMPYGARVPLCLSLLAIAKSGERKSTVERRFMKEVRAIDDNLEAEHNSNQAYYKVNLLEWKAKRKSLEKKLAKMDGEDQERDAVRCDLIELLESEPAKPHRAKLVYEDISSMAMLTALNEAGVGTLVSSEGGIIVDGKSFDAVSHLNSIWSGDSVSVARMGKPPLQINGARLTVSIMLQPSIFEPQTGKKGEKIRGSGHWARYLVFNPESTQGKRFSGSHGNSWEHLEAFDLRIREILRKARMARIVGDFERDKIRFSEASATAWFKLADRTELEIRPQGRFERASDHASKLAENVARVAALLHYFEWGEGEISLDTFSIAEGICTECSEDFLKLFVPPPEDMADAVELNELLNRIRQDGFRFIRKNYLHKRCPNAQRKGGRFFRALDVLVRNGAVVPYIDPSNAQCLDIMPYLGRPVFLPNGYQG